MTVVRRSRAVTIAGAAGIVLIAALGATVGTASRVGAASAFTVTDLGTLGGEWSQATALNDSGQVVGRAAGSDGQGHAFSWTAGGGMVDLGTLGGPSSSATAVNGHGVVVGYADRADGSTHAYSWTAAGGMVDLGALGGASSAATAVNDDGVVVGYADVAGGTYHAFLWKPGEAMTDLGTLGGPYSSASAVSASGQVVGWAMDGASLHATSWSPGGGVVDVDPAHYSAAVAVNGAGQVVGFEYSADFSYTRGFSWTSAGGLTQMGTLGGTSSSAYGVNDAGEVVGSATSADGAPHAFSWTSTAGMSDLNAPGTYGAALGINPAGQIVGYSGPMGSPQHAFSTDPDDAHVVDLGTLGGPFSGAVAVNTAGQVAGFAVTADGSSHAALYAPPTPYQRVQEVAAGLPATTPRFAEAGADLGQALNPSLWNSTGTALSYPNGMAFFDAVKQAIDQLSKVQNSPVAQKAIADLWTVAHQLAADVAGLPQLASAEARWSTGHTDALERLKQAWRSAEAAVR